MNILKRTLAVLAAITLMLPASTDRGFVSRAAESETAFEMTYNQPTEQLYTVIFRFIDAETGEPVEVKSKPLGKMSVDGINGLGTKTDEKNEVRITDLPRLMYNNSYILKVEYPEEYSDNFMEYLFNPIRSDEPDIREIKLYKNNAKRPNARREPLYTDLLFYDVYSERYDIPGIKAKLILRETDREQTSIGDGEWIIAEWESGGTDPITGEPDYVMELNDLMNTEGKDFKYFLSVEVPEGYEPIEEQEMIFGSQNEGYRIQIPLQPAGGCDTTISFVDAQTGQPLKTGIVSFRYDDNHEIECWGLDESSSKNFKSLKAIENGGWYCIDYNAGNSTYVSRSCWFRIDENDKERNIVIKVDRKGFEFGLHVEIRNRIFDFDANNFQCKLIQVAGDKETIITEWKQENSESITYSVPKPQIEGAYYKIKVETPDGYKPVPEYIIDNFDHPSEDILFEIEKEADRTARLQFVDGDTGELISNVSATLSTGPESLLNIVEKKAAGENSEIEFTDLIKLEKTQYNVFADLPDGYDDQMFDFNFEGDDDQKTIVCTVYKIGSMSQFKGCAARISLADKLTGLQRKSAKAVLYSVDVPKEIINWQPEDLCDVKYIDGLEKGMLYQLKIYENYSDDEPCETISFKFDEDNSFKDISYEIVQSNTYKPNISLTDADTGKAIPFISAELYQMNGYTEPLVAEFENGVIDKDLSLPETGSLIDRYSYYLEITLPEKYRSSDLEFEGERVKPVYKFVSEEAEKNGNGDANCDGKVNMGDVVLIMQSIANPDKYGLNGTDASHLTSDGIKNGDMDGNGITNNDALSIQKILLGLT